MTVLEDFKERFDLVNDTKNDTDIIILFSELEITDEQLNIIGKELMCLEKQDVYEYWKNKVNGSILLSDSIYTTREEQPDIQHIFNLGVQCLKNRIQLDA